MRPTAGNKTATPSVSASRYRFKLPTNFLLFEAVMIVVFGPCDISSKAYDYRRRKVLGRGKKMLRIVKSSSGQDFRITRFEDKELLAVFSRGRLLIPTFHPYFRNLVILKSCLHGLLVQHRRESFRWEIAASQYSNDLLAAQLITEFQRTGKGRGTCSFCHLLSIACK